MKLTKYEQETIINFTEADQIAGVYTHNKALIRRLEKLAQEYPGEVTLEKSSYWGQAMDYSIPKSWIRINPPRKLSEEQRAAMAERAKANLSKKPSTVVGVSDHDAPEMGKDMPQPSDL